MNSLFHPGSGGAASPPFGRGVAMPPGIEKAPADHAIEGDFSVLYTDLSQRLSGSGKRQLQFLRRAQLPPNWVTNLIRTSISDKSSGPTKKMLNIYIISVIVKQHLVQIGRIDGPIEYSSYILAAIESTAMNTT